MKCEECKNYIPYPVKYRGCTLKSTNPWRYRLLCRPNGRCISYRPMVRMNVFRIWSAHQPEDCVFRTQIRYRDTYGEAVMCLEEQDCLNGEIYLDDTLLESKDRDGIWSLGPNAKYIVQCDGEPYWNKDTQMYETGESAHWMDACIRQHISECPTQTWDYIPWPEKDIATLPKGGKNDSED